MQFQLLNSRYTELAAACQSAGPVPAPASTMSGGAVDPMAGGNEDWSRFLGKGGAGPSAFSAPTALGSQAQRVSIATPLPLILRGSMGGGHCTVKSIS